MSGLPMSHKQISAHRDEKRYEDRQITYLVKEKQIIDLITGQQIIDLITEKQIID